MQTPLLIASFPFLLFTIALERACGYPVERSSQDVNKVDPSNSWSIICPLLVEPLSARAFDVTPGKLIGIDHLPSGNIQSWEEPPNAIIEGVGSPREHHKVGARCIMANRSLNDSGSPPYFATTSTNGTIQAPSAMPSSGMKPSQTKAIVGVIIAFGILAGAIAFFKVASHQNERTRRVRSGGTPPRSAPPAQLPSIPSSAQTRSSVLAPSRHSTFDQELPLYSATIPIPTHIPFPAHMAVPGHFVAATPLEWIRSIGWRSHAVVPLNDLPPPYNAGTRSPSRGGLRTVTETSV